MLSSRLFWKILAAYAVLTLVSAAALVAILSTRQRKIVGEQIEQRLHDSAVVLRSRLADVFQQAAEADPAAPPLTKGGQGGFSEAPREESLEPPPAPPLVRGGVALQDELRRLGRLNGTRFTLVLEDGTVLGDSDEDPAQMENHRSRPELVAARAHGFGVSQRVSPTLDIPMMYYALRVGDAERPDGFVRVAMTMEAVEREVASVQRLIAAAALAVAGVAVVLTSLLAARITRPLGTLTSAAQEMADGRLGQEVRVQSGDELGLLAVAFNSMSRQLAARVEELQRKSRQLEENGQRLETVLAGMIEGVVAVDAGQQILFANRAARSLLEFPRRNVVGRPIWEVVRQPLIQDVVRNALAGGEQKPVEFELARSQAIVELIASRLPGDPCPGVVLVMHDVTELRRLENLRREFVSNVSHELKTPLTAIQAYAETLLSGAIDDPENNRIFLERIEEQAERLHALILDVLRLARIESGEDVFELTAIPLAAVVGECIEQHRALAESKGVALSAEPPELAVTVQADEDGVRTILDNLVDNAIKYTPAGGRVTVRWTSEDSAALVQVEDTGVGIATADQARIFERFYRVDQARSREVGGTGLGLSIVKHLAQVFGGSIEVTSRPGEGSTFTVRLPLA